MESYSLVHLGTIPLTQRLGIPNLTTTQHVLCLVSRSHLELPRGNINGNSLPAAFPHRPLLIHLVQRNLPPFPHGHHCLIPNYIPLTCHLTATPPSEYIWQRREPLLNKPQGPAMSSSLQTGIFFHPNGCGTADGGIVTLSKPGSLDLSTWAAHEPVTLGGPAGGLQVFARPCVSLNFI
jgi:hypothetical protein